MTDYGEMSAGELLWAIAHPKQCSWLPLDKNAEGIDIAELEPALRRAFIREASVGTISIKHIIAVGNFANDAKITFSKRPQDRVWRDYNLVPKETP